MRTTGTTGIYTITSEQTGRVYVGSSVNMAHRFSQHRQALRKGRHDNAYLQNHFDKYGESDLSFSPLIVCGRSNLEMYESRAIQSLIGGDRSKGFNIGDSARSRLGVPCSDETKARLSIAKKGKPSPLTDKGRRALSEAHKGRRRTEYEKECLRKSKLGKPRTDDHKRAISEGTKAAMSRMDKEKFRHAQKNRVYTKPRGVQKIVIDDPELARAYNCGASIVQLSKDYGRGKPVIRRSLERMGVTIRTKREVAIKNLEGYIND